MSTEHDQAMDVLDDLLQCDRGLSCREMEFIEDMDKKRDLEWTEKQIDWLDQIYTKVC